MTQQNNTKPLITTVTQQEDELDLLENRLNMYKAEEDELILNLRKNFKKQGSLVAVINQVKRELKIKR